MIITLLILTLKIMKLFKKLVLIAIEANDNKVINNSI